MSKMEKLNERYHGFDKRSMRYEREKARAQKEDRAAYEERQRKWEASNYQYKYEAPSKKVPQQPEQTWGEMFHGWGETFQGVGKSFSDFVGFSSVSSQGKVISPPPAPEVNFGASPSSLSRSSSWEFVPSPHEKAQPLPPPPSVNKSFANLPLQTAPIKKPANELVFTGHTQWGKAMQYYDVNCMPRGIIYEQDLSTQLKIGVRTKQGQHVAVITKYRSLFFPDKMAQSEETVEFSFALSKPNGGRMDERDAAYLLVNYDEAGRLTKLSVPGKVTVPGYNDNLPIITMYHGAPYILPITAGVFKFLTSKINENHGVVEIGQTDHGGIAEYIW